MIISEFSIKEISIKPAPGPEVEDPEDNILKNGTFENGSLDGWGTAGSYISNDNIVAFDIKTNNTDWTTSLYQENVTLTNGSKYKIAFDVTSTVDRYIIYGFDNTYWMPYLQLNADETKHVEYIVTGTAGGKFAIFLGSNFDRSSIAYTNENGETVTDTPFNQTLEPHRVSISSVSITELPVDLPDTENDTPAWKRREYSQTYFLPPRSYPSFRGS